jgi:hypothetical protein
MFALEPHESWGSSKIFVKGREFSSMSEILNEYLFQQLEHYEIIPNMTANQLRAFVLFRLVDKLGHPEECQELELTKENIPVLLLDESFIKTFGDFLESQTKAVVYTSLENKIHDRFRQDGTLEKNYNIHSMVRKSNLECIKKIGKDADQKWNELVQIATSTKN